jgi:hypothetical protein
MILKNFFEKLKAEVYLSSHFLQADNSMYYYK